MIYQQLFDRVGPDKTVRAGVIGTGQYATAIVTQARSIPRLEITALVDVDVEAARQAYRLAGFAEEDGDVVACGSRDAALQAIERGRRVILPDASLLMDLPVDVVVESTGVPEAGARYTWEAIRRGKHVAMVNKEADATVGPMLKVLADRAGVVYTAVDGDQPGLLISLVAWARELGLEVLCGGKARWAELVFDADAGTVSYAGRVLSLSATDAGFFRPILPGQVARFVADRHAAVDTSIREPDSYAELVITANATGLSPDMPSVHCPIVRTTEIPEVLCPVAEGGILGRRGAVDMLTCLRHPREAGLGGGVFVVVACENDYSRHVLTSKGLNVNSRDSAMLIYRPYHLCGVETAISILCAGLLGISTGAAEFLPRFDLVAQAANSLEAGTVLSNDDGFNLKALICPAQPVEAGAPLPYYMAQGNRLAVDVAAGTIISTGMVVAPSGSALWSLRAQQDGHFSRE